MMDLRKNEKGFLSLIGMVLALAITCYLFYILINSYFKDSMPVSRTANIGTGSGGEVSTGIDTSGYRSIVNSTRNTLNSVEEQHQGQINEWLKK